MLVAVLAIVAIGLWTLLVIALIAAAPQLNYRRRWLGAVELLTASDEARDQARLRGDNFAGIASDRQREIHDRQRKIDELLAEIDGWHAAAGGANDALDLMRSAAWSAGWDAYAAELRQAGQEERVQLVAARRAAREEQGRQQALRRLDGP